MIPFLLFVASVPGCQSVEHGRILGSDLASASAVFADLPADVVIAKSPAPGARRLFEPAELSRIAQANHLDTSGITPLCFERSSTPVDPARIQAAMQKSLGEAPANIEMLEMSKYPAPPGELVFPRDWLMQPVTGNSAVWNGYVAYDGGRFPIWARVRLTLPQSRLVSAVELRSGHIVGAADLRMEEASEFPRRVAPLASIEAAVGLKARRAIPAGSVLTSTMLEIPNDVERGQTVIVDVHSGGALVKMEAKAESAGRRGDTIAVRNATSGSLFRAQIEGKGHVVVKCRPQSEVYP